MSRARPWLNVACAAVAVIVGCGDAAAGESPTGGLSAEDAAYLRGVAQETWACIAYYIEPHTGLPYDTSDRGEFTSVSNLGYYAACCAAAADMGLVDRKEAVNRVQAVLDGHARFRKWKGFSQSWNSVITLDPAPHDTMISVLDSANMVAGFVVAAQALPEVQPAVEAALAEMDWSAVYDPSRGLLYGGYDLARGRLDTGWHVGDYAGDGRMAAFWSIAAGAAPPASWDNLKRESERHYGLTIFRPAWLGGGLFMQSQDGLFLDERATPAGESAADFAYAQMLYAKDLGLPAWGWSACAGPDGRYLGWGGLEVSVVTPHAVGLAAMSYPHKATACLRQLEALGARTPLTVDGEARRFGFRDSINLRTKAVASCYLPPLDQGMFFLSLANVLSEGTVQKRFESHPAVQKGRSLIPEYRRAVAPARLAELFRRDRAALTVPDASRPTGPRGVAIDDFESRTVARNLVGGENRAWTRDAADETVSVRIAVAPADADASGRRPTSAHLRIEYDVDSPNPAYGGVTFGLNAADISGCNALRFRVRSAPSKLKVELHGRGGSGAVRLQEAESDNWREMVVPLGDFGGMITDWQEMDRLVFVFEDGASIPKEGVCLLDDVAFIRR